MRHQLLSVDVGGWRTEYASIAADLARFAGRLPPALEEQCQSIAAKLVVEEQA